MIISYLIQKHLEPSLFTQLRTRTIAIKCSDLNKTWYISFEEEIHVLDAIASQIDVTITSTVSGFTRYALQQDHSAIHIAGNMHVAQLLQQIFDDLAIDWEEVIAKYTGDVIAHKGMQILRDIKAIEIDDMLQEYLQEEINMLPTKHEVSDFLTEVDQIRNRVERLQRRVEEHASNI